MLPYQEMCNIGSQMPWRSLRSVRTTGANPLDTGEASRTAHRSGKGCAPGHVKRAQHVRTYRTPVLFSRGGQNTSEIFGLRAQQDLPKTSLLLPVSASPAHLHPLFNFLIWVAFNDGQEEQHQHQPEHRPVKCRSWWSAYCGHGHDVAGNRPHNALSRQCQHD